MQSIRARLVEFLTAHNRDVHFHSLTADASTREYFRIDWHDGPAIACVYPEPFVAAEQNYLDTTRLFLAGGLPVARIYDFDGDLGVIIQEDLGDRVLREELLSVDDGRRDERIDEAISLIAKIQAATPIAYELNSIASRLKFDTEKLLWELNFFKLHYFETYKKQPLRPADDDLLTEEFRVLSMELEQQARFLCHRDFHAANLMLDSSGRMRIIDHQDARIGSPAYDLVSLLLDRITDLPAPEWLAERRRHFLTERAKLGLDVIDEKEFAYEFRLQTIQRCLKAAGTFSFQSVNRGKTYFIPFIKPMFRIALRAAENLDRFPVLQDILKVQIDEITDL